MSSATCGLCLAVWALPLQAQPIHASNESPTTTAKTSPATNELHQVEIIRTTPLPGLDVPRNQVPANVQGLNAADLKRQQSLGLADYLNENLSGITVNNTQANPFQPDVRYHGFSADSLIGSPQGMSVYMDGVRINESFGGVVNWSLIPKSAISTVTLISGSNPTYGLNTLG
ncbi:MAG: Plug domain-containing protein, partial [Sinobacteraceae bacterium]|nr:Plug domain-containing protein [Nevskiaceae bacterium]